MRPKTSEPLELALDRRNEAPRSQRSGLVRTLRRMGLPAPIRPEQLLRIEE